jgi:CHAT domain-containing protein
MIGALSTGAQGQQQTDSQTDSSEQLRRAASACYKIGWAEFGRGNIASAIEKYLESKRLFEEAHAKRDLIYILADLGSLYIYSDDYKRSRDYSEQSLALADELKDSTEPAGAWPDEYGVGTALSNLGNVSRHEASYDKAIEFFHQSLTAYRKINSDGKHNLEILDDLADIGRTYNSRGDYLRALNYLNQAMDLAKAGYPDRVASLCNSLGILYTNQRDYAKAIEFFQTGSKLAIENRDRFRQADMLLNIGVAYQFRQDYSSALKNFDSALELAKQINYSELMIPIYEGKGVVLKGQGRYKDALDSLDAGLQLARHKRDQVRTAELLWREAETHLANKNPNTSIENALQAITLAEQSSLMNVRYLALTVLGQAYRETGDNNSAMRTFAKATAQIEEMRSQVAGLENERQLFFEDKVVPYHEMVDMFAATNKGPDIEQALLTAESAKARVLLDVFTAGRINLSRVMSESEKDEERKLNQKIIDLNNQLGQQSGRPSSDLEEQLRAARARYETFQNSLYAAHPELTTKTPQVTALSLSDIDALIKPNSAFLEYIVTESKTHLLVLTKNDSGSPVLRAYPLSAAPNEIAKRTRDFRDLITTQGGFAQDARQLYDVLLKPAEQQLKGKTALCIVPDSILWDLPFQALQSRDGHYLLEDYAISYAPSFSVLKQMSLRKSSQEPTSLLAFGNPTMPSEIASSIKTTYRGEVLNPLPDAETEVGALKNVWGPTSSRILTGALAQKKVFRSEASKYKIIHFATHGILDDASPMYSRLVLARAQNDPSDDGLLEAREIMQLDLHADLVVLSACQTARGRFGAGEGMVGMSWAFFVAGVPTMVASQWKVDSASTAKLMIDFHKALKQSAITPDSKARALQQAALTVMNDPRYRHPYFWAGFVLIGNSN